MEANEREPSLKQSCGSTWTNGKSPNSDINRFETEHVVDSSTQAQVAGHVIGLTARHVHYNFVISALLS